MRIPQLKMSGTAVCLLLISIVLSACGWRATDIVSSKQLERIMSDLYSNKDVFEKHQVEFQSSYSQEDRGFLEVRPVGDPSRTLTEKQLDALKRSIYEAVGTKFPLTITVYTIGEEPHITGNMTAIDEEGRFLVASSEKFLDQEKKMPYAAWYKMAEDAILEYDGMPIKAEDVTIGSAVNVWNSGLELTSYPSQTTGLRLEITAWDDGQGDANGSVTEAEVTAEGSNEIRSITVNGETYRLLPFTQVWLQGESAKAADLASGDFVRLWFAGYDIGSERMVTQVVIER